MVRSMTSQSADNPPRMVHVATMVPQELATRLRAKADAAERSLAAELRLAIKAHVSQPATGNLEVA